jgi:hypothetical protein
MSERQSTSIIFGEGESQQCTHEHDDNHKKKKKVPRTPIYYCIESLRSPKASPAPRY